MKKEKPEYFTGEDLLAWVTPTGQVLTHGHSVLRYLGSVFGYYPRDDPMETYEIDWALDSAKAIWKEPFLDTFLQSSMPDSELKETVKEWNGFNTVVEGKLADGRKWLAGEKLTIADFLVGAHYHSVVLNPQMKCLALRKEMLASIEDRPKLKEWLERVAAEVKGHLMQRPPAPI